MTRPFDEEKLLELVRRWTTPTWIGIGGSAAHGGSEFTCSSDLDVIVGHPDESRFYYGVLSRRDVEINQYSAEKISQTLAHPEWLGSSWVWEVGKIFEADVLYGARPELQVSDKCRLIAILGCIGKLVTAEKKRAAGRRSANNDAHELTALRHLLSETWPKRYIDDEPGKLIEISAVNKHKSKLSCILRQHLDCVRFYPEHQEGAKWLNLEWKLGLTIPPAGTPF